MNRGKFISELRQALLEGNINQNEIIDTIEYYENYFDEKIREGRNIDDIIDELGSPRLIAKTIIDTKGSGNNDSNATDSGQSKAHRDNYRNNRDTNYNNDYFKFGNVYIKKDGSGTLTFIDKVKIVLYLIGIIAVIGLFIFIGISILGIILPIVLAIIVFVAILVILKAIIFRR